MAIRIASRIILLFLFCHLAFAHEAFGTASVIPATSSYSESREVEVSFSHDRSVNLYGSETKTKLFILNVPVKLVPVSSYGKYPVQFSTATVFLMQFKYPPWTKATFV